MRVLVVEDELYLAEATRDGLRLEAIAADLAGEPWVIATVPGVGYRIDAAPGIGHGGGDGG